MNITRLKIENFKCFGEETEIPFAPLTLIYGENGAGKSAIFQALYMLMNSLPRRDKKENIEHQFAHRSGIESAPFEIVCHNGYAANEINIQMELRNGEELSTLLGEYIKNPKAEFGMARKLRVCSSGISNWKNSVIQQVYNLMFEKRDVISKNYDRYVELLIMRKYYHDYLSDRTQIQNIAQNMLAFPPEPHERVWDENRIERKYCDGLEEWIKFGIPQWNDIRCSPEYKVLREEAVNSCSEDIRFFSSPFSLDEFRLRYSEGFDKLLPSDFTDLISYWARKRPPDGVNALYTSSSVRLIIRDLMLSDDPVIRLSTYMETEVDVSVSKHGYCLGCDAKTWLQTSFAKGLYLVAPEGSAWAWPYLSAVDFYCMLDEALFRQMLEVAGDLSTGVALLPPLREAPKNFYDDKSDFGALANDPPSRRLLNKWLGKLGTGYEVEFMFDKEKGSSLLLVDTRYERIPVRISETGFGFSQMLPIILECTAKKPKCIMIEEPELHIHPRLQAELGSLFVDAIHEKGHQIIAETHSEHLMLRIQRLIRSKKLSPQDVCVLYVSRDESGSSVQQLRLDEDGEFLDEWPGGFFEESFNEMFGGT